MKKRLAWLVALGWLSACGGSPANPGSGGGEVLTGGERFGWDQPASDTGELATFSYALYIDGVRSDATDVSCAAVPTASRFACTCRLPPLAAGTHSVQIAAFVTDAGVIRESDRSATVQVIAR